MKSYTPELQQVLEQATKAGYDAEIYLGASTATTIKVQDGEVDQFTLADSRGAGVRVLRDGRAGYAYTEDLSVEALTRTLEAAATNAILLPEGDASELSSFEGETPDLGLYRPELAEVPVPDKIAKAKEIERIARSADPRIKNVTGSAYSDSHGMVRLMSTRGVDRQYRMSLAWTSTVPLLFADDQHKNYYQVKAARVFAELEPEQIA
ncbi:MAG TPA: DNA gyrase modulator, partial [Stenomitos sp.]